VSNECANKDANGYTKQRFMPLCQYATICKFVKDS